MTETVDHEAFREALAPYVRELRALADAVLAVPDRHGDIAAVDSPAMREIADEGRYAAPSGWVAPVRDTHMLGGTTLFAVTDYVRVFAQALTAEKPSMYGHLVLARSALEAAVVCSWLNEPGIARDERVKRGLSDFLYSAVEVERLDLAPEAPQRVDEWIDRAAKVGWSTTEYNGRAWTHNSRGKPYVDRVTRPPVPRGITQLLVADDQARIGGLLWSRLSAVSHVTWFGLQWALATDIAAPAATPDSSAVPITASSTAVSVQAFCILRALREAAMSRFTLMGWHDDAWVAQAQQTQQVELVIARAFVDS